MQKSKYQEEKTIVDDAFIIQETEESRRGGLAVILMSYKSPRRDYRLYVSRKGGHLEPSAFHFLLSIYERASKGFTHNIRKVGHIL